ncbi:hypothetical protein HPB50_028312 [Hyalomma asiaticum]|nr:hypothetical protein HPB50_028312 [Hyalomma asiaticum]
MASIFDSFYGLGYRRSERQPQDVRTRTRRDGKSLNPRYFSGTHFEIDNRHRARKYVDAVMERLRCEMRRLGIGTAELRNMDAGPQWELRKKGTITGMDNVSPYGRAYPVPVLPENIDGAPREVHYDLSATILMEGIKFESEYGYISPDQTVNGKVSGGIDEVLLHMIIGHNLCTADKYVETVIKCLRSEMRRLGIGTAELHNMDIGPQWELRKKGTITGMDNVSPDGWAYPVAVLPENIDGAPMEVHYDVSASILMEGIKFEAEYGYISPAQMVKGKVSGRIEKVLLDMVIRHNLLRACKYVDTVMERLRSEMGRLGIGTAEMRTMHAGSEWFLRNGTITGMENVSHDGSPYPVPVLPENIDGAPTKRPVKVKYDVSAALLLQDIKFEARYDYISAEQTVRGKVSGRLENVRLRLVIGHPQGPHGAPEVNHLVVTLHSGVRLSEDSIGVLNEKKLRDATAKVLGTCIEEAISSRVAPVLNEVLKGIAYPNWKTQGRRVELQWLCDELELTKHVFWWQGVVPLSTSHPPRKPTPALLEQRGKGGFSNPAPALHDQRDQDRFRNPAPALLDRSSRGG